MIMNRIMLVLFILSQVCVVNSFCLADEQDKKEQNENQETIDTNKKVKAFLDQIEVYGRIAKPQTVFIIPGTDPRVSGIKIEKRFFNDIFRQVEKSTLRKEIIKEQRNRDHILW